MQPYSTFLRSTSNESFFQARRPIHDDDHLIVGLLGQAGDKEPRRIRTDVVMIQRIRAVAETDACLEEHASWAERQTIAGGLDADADEPPIGREVEDLATVAAPDRLETTVVRDDKTLHPFEGMAEHTPRICSIRLTCTRASGCPAKPVHTTHRMRRSRTAPACLRLAFATTTSRRCSCEGPGCRTPVDVRLATSDAGI